MCGIAGILKFNNGAVRDEEVRRLTYLMRHRGRDNESVMLGGTDENKLSAYEGIGLGHRRLSIIDLSKESNQPFGIVESKSWIVFNGELYNYIEVREQLKKLGCKFYTNSDTEVVLQAYEYWGEDCLLRFNGMFAFAIWDERQQFLFCARDPFGIKPFYYTRDDAKFSFASESAALADNGRLNLDNDSLNAYILGMYVPREKSIYSGIKKLLPGTSLTIFRNGAVTEKKYWELKNHSHSFISSERAAEEMEKLLDTAVTLQLRSDVPVGTLLSGGFDSGLLVALAAGKVERLHTYSIGFDSNEQLNELDIARSLATKYKTIHNQRLLTSNEILPYLDKAILSLSEPVSDSSIVPTYCLSEMAAADGVKVLLSGAGGDEIFGGYSRYTGYSFFRKLFLSVPHKMRIFLADSFLKNTELGKRLKYASVDMVLCEASAPQLVKEILETKEKFFAFLQELVSLYPPQTHSPLLYEQMKFDLQTYLPDLLLYEFDQMTMAHTVEGRVPYLDKELVQKAYSYHASLHVEGNRTKKIQRIIAKGKLDDRTFVEKKQGFSGPIRKWIRNNPGHFLERVREIKNISGLENINIGRICDTTVNVAPDGWYNEVFSLYCLATWFNARGNAGK